MTIFIKFKKVMKNNVFMLKYVWKYCKGNLVLRLLTTLTAPVQPFIFIISMKLAIDAIEDGKDFRDLLVIIGSAIIIGIISNTFNSWVANTSTEKAKKVISKNIQNDLLRKAQEIDLSCFDDTEFFNEYIKAMREADNRAFIVFDTFVNMISGIISLAAVSSILIILSPEVILICICVLMLNIVLN